MTESPPTRPPTTTSTASPYRRSRTARGFTIVLWEPFLRSPSSHCPAWKAHSCRPPPLPFACLEAALNTGCSPRCNHPTRGTRMKRWEMQLIPKRSISIWMTKVKHSSTTCRLLIRPHRRNVCRTVISRSPSPARGVHTERRAAHTVRRMETVVIMCSTSWPPEQAAVGARPSTPPLILPSPSTNRVRCDSGHAPFLIPGQTGSGWPSETSNPMWLSTRLCTIPMNRRRDCTSMLNSTIREHPRLT